MQNKELQAETKADSDMTRPEKSCLVKNNNPAFGLVR